VIRKKNARLEGNRQTCKPIFSLLDNL